MKIRDITLCGLFAALMALCAWFSISLHAISFTMQTFALCLALFTLGGRRGLLTIAAYLLLGAVGLPVFSNFQGGIQALLGPTGGFLWGFFLGAALYWLLTAKKVHPLAAGAAALAVSYLCGTCWYALGYLSGLSSLWAAFLQCVAPFLIFDCAKLLLAWRTAKRLGPMA